MQLSFLTKLQARSLGEKILRTTTVTSLNGIKLDSTESHRKRDLKNRELEAAVVGVLNFSSATKFLLIIL